MAGIEGALDWTKVLKRAIKRGSFTRAERGAANSWTMCAVGEGREVNKGLVKLKVKGYPKEGPEDNKLNALGVAFGYQVSEDDVDEASRTYVNIQTRLTELKLGL